MGALLKSLKICLKMPYLIALCNLVANSKKAYGEALVDGFKQNLDVQMLLLQSKNGQEMTVVERQAIEAWQIVDAYGYEGQIVPEFFINCDSYATRCLWFKVQHPLAFPTGEPAFFEAQRKESSKLLQLLEKKVECGPAGFSCAQLPYISTAARCL